jgi:type II secretory pathway component PulK
MRSAHQRGIALVIAMLLLAIVTLLAITGMRTSIGELWMAGSEQFHRAALEAAAAGVETAIARLHAGSQAGDFDGESAGAPYTVMVRHAGSEVSMPGSSAEKLVGEHFEIESTGAASRGALEVQVQGVLIVSPANGVRTFRSISGGLGPAGNP